MEASKSAIGAQMGILPGFSRARPERRPKQILHTHRLCGSSPIDIRFANCGLARALKPAGRLQISDALAQKAVREGARRDIELWIG